MKRSLSFLMFLATSVAAARAGAAVLIQTSGSACVKQDSSQTTGLILFGGWRGTTNMSTTYGVTLTCPVSSGRFDPNNDWTIEDIGIAYYDDSTSGAFDCWLYTALDDGSWYYGHQRYTCSTDGGCDSNSNASFTGAGNISWEYSEISAWGVGSIVPWGSYEVVCEVPARTGAEGSGIVKVSAAFD